MHILNSSLRKTEIHLHTASALQKYNQALVPCSKAAFEEVMSAKQQNTWAFQDSDGSPCTLCRVLQTHLQSFHSLMFL